MSTVNVELLTRTMEHKGVEDTYEPFVASEGWREEAVFVGPFLVEEEGPPPAVFDEHDLAAIAYYEH